MSKVIGLLSLLLFSIPALSQNILEGKVVGKDGLPLQYVSIAYYGKKVGSLTDATGRFLIAKRAGDSLRVFGLGYRPKNVMIYDSTITVNVILEIDVKDLEDVTVGSQRKVKSRREIGHYSSDSRYWSYLAPQLQEAVYIPNDENLYGEIEEIKFKLAEVRGKRYLLRIRVFDVDKVSGLPSLDLLFDGNLISAKKLRRVNTISVKGKNIRLNPDRGVFVSFEWLPESPNITGNERTPYILGNVMANKKYVMNNYKDMGWHLKNAKSEISGGYPVPNVSVVVAY